MRAIGRIEMPDLDRIQSEANTLLEENNLPTCMTIKPIADQDTYNPTVIGHSNEQKYVIKVTFRNLDLK